MLSWLTNNIERLLAASYFTVAGFLFFLGIILIYYINKVEFKKNGDLLYMMIGLIIESFGIAINKVFLGLWWTYNLYDNDIMEELFLRHIHLILIPHIMSLFGLILIVSPAMNWVMNYTEFHCRFKILMLTIAFSMATWWFFFWGLSPLANNVNESELNQVKNAIEKPYIKKIQKLEHKIIKH